MLPEAFYEGTENFKKDRVDLTACRWLRLDSQPDSVDLSGQTREEKAA